MSFIQILLVLPTLVDTADMNWAMVMFMSHIHQNQLIRVATVDINAGMVMFMNRIHQNQLIRVASVDINAAMVMCMNRIHLDQLTQVATVDINVAMEESMIPIQHTLHTLPVKTTLTRMAVANTKVHQMVLQHMAHHPTTLRLLIGIVFQVHPNQAVQVIEEWAIGEHLWKVIHLNTDEHLWKVIHLNTDEHLWNLNHHVQVAQQ